MINVACRECAWRSSGLRRFLLILIIKMTVTNGRNRAIRAGCEVVLISFATLSFAFSPAVAEEKTDEQPVYKYTGNLFSLKFHRPSCKFARVMWREHVVRFQYRKQAVDAGQKPCRYCLPPDWKSVDAKIVSPQGPDGVTIKSLEAGGLRALPGSNPAPETSLRTSVEQSSADTTKEGTDSEEQSRIPVAPESFGLKTSNSDSDQPRAKSSEK